MPLVFTGNKREVPANLPPILWWERVNDYAERDALLPPLPWFNEVMEYLTPDELVRVRAKVRVWYEETGEYPSDISWWWEPRMGRRRGDVPHTNETVIATIDEGDVLHCGCCGARWSDRPERCKLCDRLLVLEEA
tara:strand:+ start:743 stop:1147 length:405 start_codon:yes stop_codon:yes gene_type:complete